MQEEDFIAFLKKVAKGKMLHAVVDNLSTYKTQAVRNYLASVPKRFMPHFTPTHSSWLNLVERWFAKITNKRIRKGNFESVPQLIAAIKEYIRAWNASGRTLTWTKRLDNVIAEIKKANHRKFYILQNTRANCKNTQNTDTLAGTT